MNRRALKLLFLTVPAIAGAVVGIAADADIGSVIVAVAICAAIGWGSYLSFARIWYADD
jgi:hypothetical protein